MLDWAGEFVARVDVAWPERGLVGEADGRGKYLGEFEDGFGREPEDVARRVIAAAQRETWLRDLGLQVVRWDTAEIVSSPHRVARRWQHAAWVADPSRVRAQFVCVCHRTALNPPFDALPTRNRWIEGNKSGGGGEGGGGGGGADDQPKRPEM